jgi:hypothetical protein
MKAATRWPTPGWPSRIGPTWPACTSARIFLQPHYQLEGLSVALRLVSRLPNQ